MIFIIYIVKTINVNRRVQLTLYIRLMKNFIKIDSITGAWKFDRDPGHYRHYASTPGHLIHLVTAGSYHLRISGRDYQVSAGDLIYYHESEAYEWVANAEKVQYLSIAFMASELQPPPIQLRVLKSSPTIRKNFEKSLRLASEANQSSMLKLQVEILQVLVFLEEQKEEVGTTIRPVETAFWWHVEDTMRHNLNFRPTINSLCKLHKVSSTTLIRKCQEATKLNPLKRVQEIRMHEAVGLLKYSDFSITKISEYLGYGRIHEFSSEFSKYFGHPPSTHRK